MQSQSRLPQTSKDEVTKACVSLCCKDLRLFDIVKGAGFLEYSQILINIGAKYGNVNVKDLLPHPTTVSRSAVKEAEMLRKSLIPTVQMMMDRRECAATTDIWTDEYKHISYITLTVHFVDSNWNLCSKVLFTVEFMHDRKTATNIRLELNKQLTSMGLRQGCLSRLVFVTDQGSNIVSALQSCTRLNCSSHLLNTVQRNTFKKELLEQRLSHVEILTNQIKEVVRYMKHTGLTQHLKTTLHQETETRWYSRVDMYKSFDANYNDIENILIERQEEERMSHVQQETLKMLINFLEPFKEASLQLEADTYPTLPLVLPLRSSLLRHLSYNDLTDTDDALQLKHIALNLLEDKFVVNSFHKIACFLWPNFRQLRMLQHSEKEDIKTEVHSLIHKLKAEEQNLSSQEPSSSKQTILTEDKHIGSHVPVKRQKVVDFSCFEDEGNAKQSETDDEVLKYLKQNCGSVNIEDLLEWWKTHAQEFPYLSKVAKQFLCIPASSASSERNFSAAGLLIQERRTNLSSQSVDSILFLHDNLGH